MDGFKQKMALQLIQELRAIEKVLDSVIPQIKNIEAGMETYFPEEFEKWNVNGFIIDAADETSDVVNTLVKKYLQ